MLHFLAESAPSGVGMLGSPQSRCCGECAGSHATGDPHDADPRALRRTATAAGAKSRPQPHPHPHRGALTRAAGVSRGGKRGRAAETVSGRRRRRGRWKKTPWGSEGQRPGRWDRDQPQAQQQQQGAGCRHGAGSGWKGRRGGQGGGCSHTRSGAMNNHVNSDFLMNCPCPPLGAAP